MQMQAIQELSLSETLHHNHLKGLLVFKLNNSQEIISQMNKMNMLELLDEEAVLKLLKI